jgi:anaerobic selenocysteine-containing dehydrogenase
VSVEVRTTCNRDCPDACGIVAEVEGDRVVALRGDPEHPVTRGFLCYRTSRFLARQYHPSRITKPLYRVGDRQVEIPLDEALDIAADRLLAIRKESGPAAIFHYRSGGSLGLMKVLADYFFERFGPVTAKIGDICSGAGDAAQMNDFGEEESSDVFDLLNARHIINWGKNLHVSNLHLIPILRQARAQGTTVTLIDPVYNRSAELAEEHVMLRPGGDVALALAVARILFDENRIAPNARELCDHLDEFRALATSRPLEGWLAECDVPAETARKLAAYLADGPAAILVGWGLQRRLRGASAVRLLDALGAITGNIGRSGGGVSFYFKRRGAFDLSFMNKTPAPRALCEPVLGRELLEAKDPPIRAVWVTAGNPVAMLPDSATVARAFSKTEFVVAVDAFPTDTTRRATLVLPTTTLLEDDDLLGAYGHHWIGVSRPVVPPPPGVLTDLQILQEIARRVGLGEVMAGSAREWKARMLAKVADRGASIDDLERGHVRNPIAPRVVFEGGRVATASGRVNLIHALPEEPNEDEAYPLHLVSTSTEKAQSSQWSIEHPDLLPAIVHPLSALGLPDGARVRLVSAIGSIEVRLVHDPRQRRDVVIVPKGGHYDRGGSANTLIRARRSDDGDCAAYQNARVRIEA